MHTINKAYLKEYEQNLFSFHVQSFFSEIRTGCYASIVKGQTDIRMDKLLETETPFSKFSIFRCVYKAKEGECQNNPQYMMQNCQAECRQFGVRFIINVTWYYPKVLPVIQLSTTRGAKIAN